MHSGQLIYDLFHSLSVSEKNAFFKFLKGSRNSTARHIFKILSEQKLFIEKELRLAFPEGKSYSYWKRRCLSLFLEFLFIRRKSSKEICILKAFIQKETLLERGFDFINVEAILHSSRGSEVSSSPHGFTKNIYPSERSSYSAEVNQSSLGERRKTFSALLLENKSLLDFGFNNEKAVKGFRFIVSELNTPDGSDEKLRAISVEALLYLLKIAVDQKDFLQVCKLLIEFEGYIDSNLQFDHRKEWILLCLKVSVHCFTEKCFRDFLLDQELFILNADEEFISKVIILLRNSSNLKEALSLCVKVISSRRATYQTITELKCVRIILSLELTDFDSVELLFPSLQSLLSKSHLKGDLSRAFVSMVKKRLLLSSKSPLCDSERFDCSSLREFISLWSTK